MPTTTGVMAGAAGDELAGDGEVAGSRAAVRMRERGQATVEYVGLAVAVAVLLVSVGGGLGTQGEKLGGAVAKRLQSAISATG